MSTRVWLCFLLLPAALLRAGDAADTAPEVPDLKLPAPVPRADEAVDRAAPRDVPAAAESAVPDQTEIPGDDDRGSSVAAEESDNGMVPAPFPVSRYRELWERSPFQLESIAPPVESAGLAQRYALTGIAEINGEPIAFLMERATQQRLMVRSEAGEGDLSLVQVNVIQKKYDDSTATVRQGSEVGVVKFDAGPPMPVPAMGMPAPQAMAPGMPGAPPVQVPGMPVQPQPPGIPGQPSPQVAGGQPGMPVPGMPQDGQIQQPGQQPMPPPRVIRRRAIVPAAP
jgi:hypothetical protein